MSENAHNMLQVIQAIALYVEKGPAYAAGWLMQQGWSAHEAFTLLDQYEDARDRVIQGVIP